MEYIQVTFRTDMLEDFVKDIIPAFLGEIGFDSFEENNRGVIAYCQKNVFSLDDMKNVIASLPIDNWELITYRIDTIQDNNWNSVWEQTGFQPIEISDNCIIRPKDSNFSKDYKYNIILNPTQSFGSGYHETTRMMLNYLMELSITDNNVLDMGTGTAILAIMASMRDANNVTAIDIDEWSQRNAEENIKLNNLNNISVKLGDASILKTLNKSFDLVLANINRNILINDMEHYCSVMKSGATILFSGFYSEDLIKIQEKGNSLNLTFIDNKEDNNWIAARFIKK